MYKDYKDLKVWQRAHELVKEIYQTSFNFKGEEKYGLQSQLKRSAVSVPANIAEGATRQYNKEFKQFLFIAKGALSETSYYILLCYELDYISKEVFELLYDKCNHVDRMLSSLIGKINV